MPLHHLITAREPQTSQWLLKAMAGSDFEALGWRAPRSHPGRFSLRGSSVEWARSEQYQCRGAATRPSTEAGRGTKSVACDAILRKRLANSKHDNRSPRLLTTQRRGVRKLPEQEGKTVCQLFLSLLPRRT